MRKLGPSFEGIDGVSQWKALSSASAEPASAEPASAESASAELTSTQEGGGAKRGVSSGADDVRVSFPRTELLHNIGGVHGTGAAVIRRGVYKLLHNMQADRGFDGWCEPCSAPAGCHVPAGATPSATLVASAAREYDGMPRNLGLELSPHVVAFGGQLCCL